MIKINSICFTIEDAEKVCIKLLPDTASVTEYSNC